MIKNLETSFCDFTIEDNFPLFEEKDASLLRELLSCANLIHIPGDYRHWVECDFVCPAHVEWMKEDLEGYCLIELDVENHFRFWFTSEADKISFARAFDGEE